MIKWEGKYSVGLSIIDKEHKELIRIMNTAIEAKQHNDNIDEILILLKQLTDYALKHFSTEEFYMAKFKYSEFQYHQEEHHNFSNKAIAYCNRVIEGDNHIANEILEYLKQWLVDHIQKTDKKYVECFKKNGLE
jgi:hemerythrin-like metal-binding protein